MTLSSRLHQQPPELMPLSMMAMRKNQQVNGGSTSMHCHASTSARQHLFSSSASTMTEESSSSSSSTVSSYQDYDQDQSPTSCHPPQEELNDDQPQCEYHTAPQGVEYSQNPTVFGQILQGTSPAITLHETTNTLCFKDIHPHAPLHGLVIPKRCIRTIQDLQSTDLELLEEMFQAARAVLQQHQPQAWKRGDYRLCFHVPPFNSVNHLHLHVMAPVAKMNWYPRYIRYNVRTELAVSLDTVRERLMMMVVPPEQPRQKETMKFPTNQMRKQNIGKLNENYKATKQHANNVTTTKKRSGLGKYWNQTNCKDVSSPTSRSHWAR